MKKVTKYILGAAVALGIVGGVAANKGGEYCHGADHMAKRGDKMVKRVTKKLNLNDGQQVLLQELQQSMQGKMQALHENRAESKQAFMELFGAQFDQGQALGLMQEKADTVNQHAPELIAAFANFYDSLDTKQQAKMMKFMEKRGGHRMGFWGKGRHHDGDHDEQTEQS